MTLSLPKKYKIFLSINMTSSACNHYIHHIHLVSLESGRKIYSEKKDTVVGDNKS